MAPERALAWLRLGFVGVWLAPRFTAEVFGLDPDGHPGIITLSRLIAAREAALGAILLTAGDRHLDVTVAAAAADLAGIGRLWRRGDIRGRTVALGAATVAAQLTLGLQGRRRPALAGQPFGSPSARSATMFRMTSSVPPARRKPGTPRTKSAQQ